jgi:glycosyltransferase involved in cell wall biosynthesis
MKKVNVAILVPSYNEAANLPIVIENIIRISSKLDHTTRIVIIDDGSTDQTIRKIQAIKDSGSLSSQEVTLLAHPFNCGVGVAMRTGFSYAKEHGFDYAIQIDADGQHSPESYPAILERLIQGANLVIGSRFLSDRTKLAESSHTSKKRALVLRIVSKIISWAANVKITDSTSGFRGVDIKAISYFADNYPSEYLGDTLNSIILAKSRDFRIEEIPVVMKSRISGDRSQNYYRSFLFLIRALLNVMISLIERRKND